MAIAVLHATAVAHAGRALLITGPSGSGKSSLALSLMAFGAALIADDRTQISAKGDTLWASAPLGSPDLVEARGLGLLRAARADPAPIVAEVDLGRAETDRLPPWREVQRLGITLPLLHKPESTAFPAMLLQYLNHGLINPDQPVADPPAEALEP